MKVQEFMGRHIVLQMLPMKSPSRPNGASPGRESEESMDYPIKTSHELFGRNWTSRGYTCYTYEWSALNRFHPGAMSLTCNSWC